MELQQEKKRKNVAYMNNKSTYSTSQYETLLEIRQCNQPRHKLGLQLHNL